MTFSVPSRTAAGRRQLPVVVAAAATGAGTGAAAVAAVLLPRDFGVVLAALVLCLCAWAVVGDPRPALLGLVALDLPLQLDTNLGYQAHAGQLGAFGGINVSVTTLALAGLVAVEIGAWAMGERRTAPGRSLVTAYAAYVALAAASVVWARDRFLASAWALLLVQSLLLLWVLPRVLRSRGDVQRFVGFLLAGLAAEATLIIYQAVFGAQYVVGQARPLDLSMAAAPARVAGTLGSPNVAAAYLSMLAPLALAVVLAKVSPRLRALAGVAFVLGVAALLLGTVSRGGALALLVGCGIVLVVATRRGWVGATHLLVLGTALVVIPLGAGAELIARLHSDAGAAEGRIPLLSLAAQMVRDHPLQGVGANNFVAALPDYLTPRYDFAWIYVVHNDYLLVFAELGVVGLLAYACFLFRLVRLGVQAVARGVDPFLGPLVAGCAGAICGRLVHMNVDVFNGRSQVQALVTVAALLIVADALRTSSPADLAAGRTTCAE
jgi:putative inorganic carbon (HCO3(-)) transporter